jgi:hypothetical protein
MSQAKHLAGGWPRLALILGAVAVFYVLTFVIFDDSIQVFLKWIEFLAPAAGLSGLWLVFMTPVFFLGAVFVGGWIHAGFKADAG